MVQAEELFTPLQPGDLSLTGNVSASDKLYQDMVGYVSEESEELSTPEVVLHQSLAESARLQSVEELNKSLTQSKAEQKYGVYTPLRELEWTTVPLVAFGFLAKADKKNFREARNNFIPSYENHLDDYIQHAPLAAVFAMKLAGYESRSDWYRFLASGAMSYGFMALLVNSIKYTAKEMRPDGSTANSFPSGHTATAFVAATIMHKEYGLTRSPWWSVLAYACATTTGIMRTLNNRHWISDVLVGAGIGVISTDLGYMMGDLIFKKKHLLREPRQQLADLNKTPSFFKVSLGMQFANNLRMPAETDFATMTQAWDKPGASSNSDDLYTIIRYGNPFRIPDDFDQPADKRTYDNYGNSITGNGGASTIYKDPKIKVGTGTTVGAEAAYFFSKYIGAGLRARITTAPVVANGLSCYNHNMIALESSSVSDVWSIVDANIGLYFNIPLAKRHNIGLKALYGRKFFSSLDLVAAYDANIKNTQTGETANVTMYGDNLMFDKTSADAFATGVHYTYAMGSGMAVSAFLDYDYSKPEYDVTYAPFHSNPEKMIKTKSSFSYSQKYQSLTLGASLTVMF